MKNVITLLFISFCILNLSAQYYNPYASYQQAYEYGRRMAEQMQQQEDDNLRRNPTLMAGKMIQLLAFGTDDEKAYEYAEYLAEEKDLVAGWFWLGVLNETGIGTSYSPSYAKTCYQNGAKKRNGQSCKQRLTEISNGNELDENTVRKYCQNIVVMGSSVTLPDFGGGINSPLNIQSSTCSSCNGTGECKTCHGQGWYYHETGYYTGRSGKSRTDCPVCHGTGRCGTCHGKGSIR